MRKIISLFIFSLCIFQFACAQDNIADPNLWDFGQAKASQVLKHDFLFKNETKNVLNITSVNTSCGCTASQPEKKSLKPGETTKINVSFNPHGYLGQVQQFVYVNTDNADAAVARFTIKAEIIK